ncbi:uncharacterized protein CIMG_13228 [Coccidioides immitis RS]|uniref:Uncharacterized protein n=1 Tax=Coccidioides immitis (strain RS) TaxID=246410 RepID=A0A0D8JWX8_COCIM|nr:uncharacterized protein CIMG_13228 [Coccidioides immitis RS]KJF60788.1 hypothetical protein CIMG_13228 [Coccidioides immitis RS]
MGNPGTGYHSKPVGDIAKQDAQQGRKGGCGSIMSRILRKFKVIMYSEESKDKRTQIIISQKKAEDTQSVPIKIAVFQEELDHLCSAMEISKLLSGEDDMQNNHNIPQTLRLAPSRKSDLQRKYCNTQQAKLNSRAVRKQQDLKNMPDLFHTRSAKLMENAGHTALHARSQSSS